MTHALPSGQVPQIIWDNCPICGKRFSTSARAVAEGRDICRKCYEDRADVKSSHNTSKVSGNHFRLLYSFFLSLYVWWPERQEAMQHSLLQCYTAILKRKHDDELLCVETIEWRMLNTLYSRYGDWLVTPDERRHKQMFYALWQLSWYYHGSEQEAEDGGE